MGGHQPYGGGRWKRGWREARTKTETGEDLFIKRHGEDSGRKGQKGILGEEEGGASGVQGEEG